MVVVFNMCMKKKWIQRTHSNTITNNNTGSVKFKIWIRRRICNSNIRWSVGGIPEYFDAPYANMEMEDNCKVIQQFHISFKFSLFEFVSVAINTTFF